MPTCRTSYLFAPYFVLSSSSHEETLVSVCVLVSSLRENDLLRVLAQLRVLMSDVW
jgi:hypothetical protein